MPIPGSCSLDTEIANLVKKNREEILRELKIVYSRKGCVEYTPRMGELLILLASQEVGNRRWRVRRMDTEPDSSLLTLSHGLE